MSRAPKSIDVTGWNRTSNELIEMDCELPGCEPGPIQRDEDDAVARAFQCTAYRDCQEIAIQAKWEGWDCMACPSTISKQEIE